MKRMMILAIIAIFSVFIVAGCNNTEQKSESNSYVSVEINPSVELVVDEDNVVVAANGTNDDGKTLIINVSFEGKELSEALEIILTEAKESGYLLSATYNSDLVSRDIKVSIDSENATVEASINDVVKDKVNKFIEENDLAARYEKIEAKGREYFEAIVKRYNPMITDEELEALTYEDLLEMVELATIEKSQMATIALEEYYLNFKEYEFKFAYKEEVAAKLNELNPIIGKLYSGLLNSIKSSVETLNELEYGIYVSEESEYLKLLNQLNGYKDEVIKLKVELAVNEDSTEIELEIKAKEELIDKVMADIETVMNTLRSGIDTTRAALNKLYEQLETYEQQVENLDFNEILTKVEADVNSSKDGICSSFETTFADEIAKVKTNQEERKASLESK